MEHGCPDEGVLESNILDVYERRKHEVGLCFVVHKVRVSQDNVPEQI